MNKFKPGDRVRSKSSGDIGVIVRRKAKSRDRWCVRFGAYGPSQHVFEWNLEQIEKESAEAAA